MKTLTKEKREFLESLLKLKPQKEKDGYYRYSKRVNAKKKNFRRSRVLMQLHLNKKLEMWEIVHHKDGNKENDAIENLEVMDLSKHNSITHAGRRSNKITTIRPFYTKPKSMQ